MQRLHRDFIWTDHALERARERGLTQDEVWLALRRPDKSEYAAKKGGFEFTKVVGGKLISVVATQNEHKQWVILSAWSNPVWQKSTLYKTPLIEKILQKLFGRLKTRFSKR